VRSLARLHFLAQGLIDGTKLSLAPQPQRPAGACSLLWSRVLWFAILDAGSMQVAVVIVSREWRFDVVMLWSKFDNFFDRSVRSLPELDSGREDGQKFTPIVPAIQSKQNLHTMLTMCISRYSRRLETLRLYFHYDYLHV
jgi:hypothetical protein